jgi:peptidoglycan/xylan/chitin deacetylase (PgdA/CDA1 family)
MDLKISSALLEGRLWGQVLTEPRDIQTAAARGIPVLVFHKIGTPGEDTLLPWLYVKANTFRSLIAELAAAEFSSIPLSALVSKNWADSRRELVITFDDGYAATLADAGVPLHEYGFSATQFLIADRLGQLNEWDREPLMDRQQVKEWLSLGHEIGAHTLTHPSLTKLDHERARQEIVCSKKKLEDLFGVGIKHFAFPHGDFNERILEIVQEAGFSSAVATTAQVVTNGFNPWTIPRLYFLERQFRLSGLQQMKRRLGVFGQQPKILRSTPG